MGSHLAEENFKEKSLRSPCCQWALYILCPVTVRAINWFSLGILPDPNDPGCRLVSMLLHLWSGAEGRVVESKPASVTLREGQGFLWKFWSFGLVQSPWSLVLGQIWLWTDLGLVWSLLLGHICLYAYMHTLGKGVYSQLGNMHWKVNEHLKYLKDFPEIKYSLEI